MKDTYTMLYDSLVAEYGLIVAAVYGRVQRFAQGDHGKCTASVRTIAQGLGLGKSSVYRSIGILIDAGLVEDLTPNAIKKPHELICASVPLRHPSVPHRDTSVPQGDASVPLVPPKRQLRDNEETKKTGAVFSHYESEVGMLTPMVAEMLGEWIDDYGAAWTIDAISEAVLAGVTKPNYIKAILKNWKEQGRATRKPKAKGIPEIL